MNKILKNLHELCTSMRQAVADTAIVTPEEKEDALNCFAALEIYLESLYVQEKKKGGKVVPVLIPIGNILSIIDVAATYVSQDTISFLKENNCMAYEDRLLKEHIYNMEEAIDIEAESFPSEIVKNEVSLLHATCARYDAGYVRFIF